MAELTHTRISRKALRLLDKLAATNKRTRPGELDILIAAAAKKAGIKDDGDEQST